MKLGNGNCAIDKRLLWGETVSINLQKTERWRSLYVTICHVENQKIILKVILALHKIFSVFSNQEKWEVIYNLIKLSKYCSYDLWPMYRRPDLLVTLCATAGFSASVRYQLFISSYQLSLQAVFESIRWKEDWLWNTSITFLFVWVVSTDVLYFPHSLSLYSLWYDKRQKTHRNYLVSLALSVFWHYSKLRFLRIPCIAW